MKKLIEDAWNGEEELWRVFWIYGVVFSIVLQIVLSIIEDKGIFLLLVFIVLFISWSFWNIVSIWKCAFNCDLRLWGYLARTTIIINLFWFGYEIGLIFKPAYY